MSCSMPPLHMSADLSSFESDLGYTNKSENNLVITANVFPRSYVAGLKQTP